MGFWVYVVDVDSGEMLNIHTDDCDYIERDNKSRRLKYHIGQKTYLLVTNLEEQTDALRDSGYMLTDITNLVNLRKVKQYDSKFGELYFDDPVTNGSKIASVARIHADTLNQMFGLPVIKKRARFRSIKKMFEKT